MFETWIIFQLPAEVGSGGEAEEHRSQDDWWPGPRHQARHGAEGHQGEVQRCLPRAGGEGRHQAGDNRPGAAVRLRGVRRSARDLDI